MEKHITEKKVVKMPDQSTVSVKNVRLKGFHIHIKECIVPSIW
jgi:hypothetical protein